MKSILASMVPAVNAELAKLPSDTKVAVVGIARKQQGEPGVVQVYAAYRFKEHWKVDAEAHWVENAGFGVETHIVFAK